MDTIVILDFGSQVTQLIARRLRAMKYHAEIVPYFAKASQGKPFSDPSIKGIILSGGPSSVYAKNGALPDPGIFELGKPILGICYGIQVLAHMLGGRVKKGVKREYGRTTIKRVSDTLFAGTSKKQIVWMSHFDIVTRLPKGFKTIGYSSTSPHAAIADIKRHFYGVQFHLEVAHTEYGTKILENFAKICGMRAQWTSHVALDHAMSSIQTIVKNG